MAMFKDGDVICFLGDSITANGLWMAEVYQNIKKHNQVKCYNRGVSGITATKTATFLHERCLCFNPYYVVMMFGINDVNINLYKKELAGDKETEEKKKAAILAYKNSYEGLVKETIASGAKVILCTSTPYDDQNDKEEEALECMIGLYECVAYLRTLAEKYSCKLVDFMSVMQPMLTKANILSPDRVHPSSEGHHVMAQIFLKEIGLQAECDFDTPFVFEEWNRERYDAEKELNLVNFVEFCAFYKEKYVDKIDLEHRKRIAKERYESYEDKNRLFPFGIFELS